MKKKLLMILSLCIIMIVCAVGLMGCNGSDKEGSKGLKYEYTQDGYVVCGIGDCTDTEIVIPTTYDGKPVIGIGDYAFRDCSSLKSVYIPKSVIYIGYDAFHNCSSLTSIDIPTSVIEIDKGAFSGCSSLRKMSIPFVGFMLNVTVDTHFGYIFGSSDNSYVPNSLKEVVVTGSNCINDGAFSGCSFLTSVTIQDTVTSIGKSAFEDCSKLTSVTIPNSVTSIGKSAFLYCSSLESIEIPNSVTSIGEYAFYGCSKLASITIPFVGNTLNGTSNIHFDYIFGASSYVPSSLKEVIITGGTSIGSSAFANCSSLESIEIPSSVTSIGERAFFGCSALNSIEIPYGVTIIGGSTFYNCTSLESIDIPNSIISIGDSVFNGCSALKSVMIPYNVTSIGKSVFRNCTSLTGVTFSDTTTWYITSSSTSWNDKSDGSKTDVTNATKNATNFKSTYLNYYWYKI